MSHTIFLTGATGYLGQAAAQQLVADGHTVLGLTRTPAKAAELEAIGVEPVVGHLQDPASFTPALERCRAVVHAASDHDVGAARVDGLALDAYHRAAERGTLQRLVYTSGLWVHGETGGPPADEAAPLDPLELVRWRPAIEQRALSLADHGVASSVLRPVLVYGEARSLIGGLFDQADRDGVVRVPGDGAQRWCLVHREDLARAYAAVLERAAPRSVYIVDEGSPLTARQVIEAIATAAGARTESTPADQVVREHGPFGQALLADVRVRADKLRRELGWTPQHAFARDIDAVHREWKAARAAAAG